MQFRCWDEERQDESEALLIEAPTAKTAAEMFCEKRFSQDSYPQHRTIHVAQWAPVVFEVETRNSPEFIASERRPK